MGVLILAAILLVAAFALALVTAAFFAYHFWRLQASHEALLDKFANLKAGRLPVVPVPRDEPRAPGLAWDDEREAEAEKRRIEAAMYR